MSPIAGKSAHRARRWGGVEWGRYRRWGRNAPWLLSGICTWLIFVLASTKHDGGGYMFNLALPRGKVWWSVYLWLIYYLVPFQPTQIWKVSPVNWADLSINLLFSSFLLSLWSAVVMASNMGELIIRGFIRMFEMHLVLKTTIVLACKNCCSTVVVLDLFWGGEFRWSESWGGWIKSAWLHTTVAPNTHKNNRGLQYICVCV